MPSADITRRRTTVTLHVLSEYKDMIQSTTLDLQDHLEDINKKLQTLTVLNKSSATQTSLHQIWNEKDSTERCLEICAGVLAHVNSLRLHTTYDIPSVQDPPQTETEASALTSTALGECNNQLTNTISELEKIRDLAEDSLCTPSSIDGDTGAEIRRLQRELDSTKQRLMVCEGASDRARVERVHSVEDIQMGDDGRQLFVSSLGDLFNIKNAYAGNRALQFVGSIPDDTLRDLLKGSHS